MMKICEVQHNVHNFKWQACISQLRAVSEWQNNQLYKYYIIYYYLTHHCNVNNYYEYLTHMDINSKD
jgi:hypothetical protein